MSDEVWTWTTEEVIPSELGAGADFVTRLLERLEQLQWCTRDIFSVRLAIEEALANAIRHGNGLDREKRVRIGCKMAPKRLVVEVSDEGPGFEPKAIPDPTSPENIERPGGRGLLLMRSFMTRVEFNEPGNCVVMEKRPAR